jgi:hypothetical protein
MLMIAKTSRVFLIKWFCIFTILLALILTWGCDGNQGGSRREKVDNSEITAGEVLTQQNIIGRWISDVAKSEIGDVVSIIDFRHKGKFQSRSIVVSESPPGELIADGTYKVSSDKVEIQYDPPANARETLRVRMREGEMWIRVEKESEIDPNPSQAKETRFRRFGY